MVTRLSTKSIQQEFNSQEDPNAYNLLIGFWIKTHSPSSVFYVGSSHMTAYFLQIRPFQRIKLQKT